jgi:hypothetical protein
MLEVALSKDEEAVPSSFDAHRAMNMHPSAPGARHGRFMSTKFVSRLVPIVLLRAVSCFGLRRALRLCIQCVVQFFVDLAVQGSAIAQGRNRSDDSRYCCDDCGGARQYLVNYLRDLWVYHFPRLAFFNFAILIARTFFIIRRKVALSALLSPIAIANS